MTSLVIRGCGRCVANSRFLQFELRMEFFGNRDVIAVSFNVVE